MTRDGAAPETAELVRSEEELSTRTERVDVGELRLRKEVDEHEVSTVVPRGVEHAEVEREAAEPDDVGDVRTLPDGSISVPVFEEEIVVTRRLVVRERIVVRKRTVTEQHEVSARVRRERVEVDVDDAVDERVHVDDLT